MDEVQIAALVTNLQNVVRTPEGIDMLAKLVANNELTIDRLQNTGALTPSVAQQITAKATALTATLRAQQAAAEQEQAEAKLWNECDGAYTIQAYEKYLAAYPQGKYADRARNNIATLKYQAASAAKGKYINALKEDINAYDTQSLAFYGITKEDLAAEGIYLPESILRIWDNSGVELKIGDTPESIESGRTEVYFWGTPGSGKTCTLAAVLGQAKRRGLLGDREGSGHFYMTQLSNIFNTGTATLPPPSPVEVTQALNFDLRDEQKNLHPVSLIEISGEIFQCFSNKINGMEIPDDGHLQTFNSLHSFLRNTSNPKFHFFVIDVNNTEIDANGLSQMDYLQAAATYFNSSNIFNEKTAGIYVLVTKSDLLSKDSDQRAAAAIQHLSNQYLNFCNSLKTIAVQHGLIPSMNDKLSVVPFTLGEVYLKNKCVFNPATSDHVIKIMQDNIAKTEVKRRSRWLNL